MQERIICAAIHVKDGRTDHVHQCLGIEEGFVIAGRRHHNCYYTLSLMGEPYTKLMVGREGQGFITSNNRYVDRKEGMKIAKAAGQLINPALHPEEDDILISEDLY